MANPSLETKTKPTTNNRRFPHGTTVVVLVAVVAVGVVLMFSPRFGSEKVEAPTSTISAATTVLMAESAPARIVIPTLKIDAAFSAPLGLEDSGEIEVPDDYVSVGYYKNGPTPGEIGPAVILGHVDSVKGPAVFFSLGQLKEGDEVNIEREDGTVATFEVTEVEKNSQADFPTEKVYGKLDYAGIRLITCSGVYDRNKLRYSHNLIVYGKLLATSTKAI